MRPHSSATAPSIGNIATRGRGDFWPKQIRVGYFEFLSSANTRLKSAASIWSFGRAPCLVSNRPSRLSSGNGNYDRHHALNCRLHVETDAKPYRDDRSGRRTIAALEPRVGGTQEFEIAHADLLRPKITSPSSGDVAD